MSSKRKQNKLFNSLLIFTLIFTLFAPSLVLGKTTSQGKSLNVSNRMKQLESMIQKQESLLTKSPTLHPSLKNAKGNEKVNVIVQFSEAPVALEKGKQTVKGKTFTAAQESKVINKVVAQQAAFEKQLKVVKVSYKKGFTYDQALNGMSLTLSAKDIQKLINLKGVISVDPVTEVYALNDGPTNASKEVSGPKKMNKSNEHLDIPAIWEMGYEGEGVKVAVLDTGIDYNHPEFEGVYKGGKNFVPHVAGDYARERAADDPYETSPLDRPSNKPEFDADGDSFYTSHGTHVAGTIAAQGKNEYGIKGIAPKIELYAYRVLGAYGSGSTDGIIAAIDESVKQDMDIINLSLGGGSNSQTAPDSIAINNATLAGVTAVVATGNSGPERSTIGNPASSALAISVGNSTLPEVTTQATLKLEAGEYSNQYNANLMGWTFDQNPGETMTGTYEVVAVPGFGAEADYAGLNVEGKVPLVSRGNIAFVDKIAAAKKAGAKGVIIHNNVEGAGPANVFLSDSFAFIPTYDISTADGKAFRDAIATTVDKVGKVTFSNYKNGAMAGDEMNDSSSRGPSTPTFDIKPDVSAPGTNIMSSVASYGKDYPGVDYTQSYDRYTGTSMATPHIAGIAALLLSAHPDWTPADVKVALSNTAKQLDTELFDVFAQGPGRVQPVEAITTDVLAYALDTTDVDGKGNIINYEKGTVTFGKVVPNSTEENVVTKQIKVKELADVTGDFNVEVQVTKAATGALAGAKVTVDKSSFTLNGEETLTVSLTVPKGEDSPGNELLGYIKLTNGSTKLSLPFAASFSDVAPTGVEYFELENYAISPDGDGKLDTTNLYFGLFDQQAASIELWNAENPLDGFGDGYIGFYEFSMIPQGYWRLPIGGTYTDWRTNKATKVPEGVYTIDFGSWNLENGEITYLAWDGPFFVKTTDPKIAFDTVAEEIDGKEYVLTGKINDKFVDFKTSVNWAGIFGLTYNVNDNLAVQYDVKDVNGNVVGNGPVTLKQDGTFAISLSELPSGENTLTLNVEDIAKNSAKQEVKLNVKVEAPKEFNVTLTPSTTEPTEGPVTVTVETDSEEELVALKWLKGEKVAADFVEGGVNIDPETKSFDVAENDTYTVFAKNSVGVEAVQFITVDNIVQPPTPITVGLTPSTTEPTEGPLSVVVDTDSKEELESLKWLEGNKTVADFAEAGNEIDLVSKTFEVTANGTYTVYAKNTAGVEAVQTITVDNITVPVKPITVELTPSTTEPTEGEVTVNVTTDSESDLVAMKWLSGEKTAADFADNAGTNILDSKSFNVLSNGTYTVYVKNLDGAEAVQTITVSNIVEPVEPVTIELGLSSTEPTEGPVTVTVAAEGDIVEMKWLEGQKSLADFANAGMNIDLSTKSFLASKNGFYTVYVKNSDGVEAVQTIEVTNIVAPKPEDPKPEDPKPEDPKQEDPKPEDPKQDDKDKDGNQLPNTATATYNYLVFGAALLMAGFLAMFLQHRRNKKAVQ